MLRHSSLLLRRGMPRPRQSLYPEKYRRVPAALKMMQGGQQHFNDFMLKTVDDDIRLSEEKSSTAAGAGSDISARVQLRLGQEDFSASRDALDAALREELRAIENDSFTEQRSFNELEWFQKEQEAAIAASDAALPIAAEPDGTLLPDRVADNDYFKSRFGYSLVKNTELPAVMDYKELDLWAEMPKYSRDMIFFYVISRRRNTYAVAFDFSGRRLLKPYTAGNRGLKGGDRGFRAEGSTDNGHQVMSMYINDVIPVIRERRASEGNPLARGDKLDIVVRVMGFYNGRQGGVRALTDRSDIFTVRYFEDITPFPLNGPKMPRGVFK